MTTIDQKKLGTTLWSIAEKHNQFLEEPGLPPV
jgi:hypothetical protein